MFVLVNLFFPITGYCNAQNRIVVDLNIGETKKVTLVDGNTATLKLLAMDYQKDARKFVGSATVTIEVNGIMKTLSVGMYNMPVTIGKLKIDCTVTKDYYKGGSKHNRNWWNLAFTKKDVEDYGYDYQKDARFRLWPKDAKLFKGVFRHPINRRWGSSYTQLDNEHVEQTIPKLWEYDPPYYHAQVDIGASNNKYEIYSPVDGVVVRCPRIPGKKMDMIVLDDPKYQDILSNESGIFWDRCGYDITIIDENGWVYLFGHMRNIEVELGDRVKAGQKIAYTGNVQARWPHLHFGIWAPQPSGKYGSEPGYAYCWESYVNEQSPAILAVTGHHRIINVGEKVTFSAEGSQSFKGKIIEYKWLFCDGATGSGKEFTKTYNTNGMFTEILRVKDDKGNTAYNTSTVISMDTTLAGIGRMWLTYYPSLGLKAGNEVEFETRILFFKPVHGDHEVWDFGDGSPAMLTDSEKDYANPKHVYRKPGDYIVTVKRGDIAGNHIVARNVVHVE